MVVDEVVRELDLSEQRAREADVGLDVDAVLANPLRQRSARDTTLPSGYEERVAGCGVVRRHVRL